MMAGVNLLPDQINTVSKIQAICASILDDLTEARQLVQEATDKGYAAGGANVITDAILQTATASQALVATDVAAAITALSSIDTTLAATTRAGYKALERLRP